MGLYKRGQVWWMQFTYQGRLVRKSTEVSDKKLAGKIHAKVTTQIAEGKWFERLPGEDKTLGDLLERYVSDHSVPNKAPSTVRLDRAIVKDILAYFGDIPLKEVTPNRISSYKSVCRAKGLAPSSVRYRLCVLRHAFNLAIREWEWVKDNPATRVSKDKVDNARDRWLTIEEEERLLNASVLYATGEKNVKIPHYWAQEIVIVALNTGMRQDEILSLRWPDVDLFRKTVAIIRSKNGEKRTIPMSQRVFELLKEKARVRNIRSDLVFASEAGTKIHDRNLRRAFFNALERSGIADFKFHDLRHTFATRLVQAGVDLYTVSKLLGHKDIKMSQRYAHHCPESLRSGVAVLDRISTSSAQSAPEMAKGVTDCSVTP
ncbi:MAG: hypothetical protein A3J24_01550 [Deltaproteobacteria bacterium RIFCSPLOWO2_02_FULL_53_8]|nr:MAG: hypothetical protein A3J24_01550 [Deltaproteobacteria bacterium RIFCSPLOWO2_02_FULL_53_8]